MKQIDQLALEVCGNNPLAQLAFKQGFRMARDMAVEIASDFDRDTGYPWLEEVVSSIGEQEVDSSFRSGAV